jgi:hypothetical protein
VHYESAKELENIQQLQRKVCTVQLRDRYFRCDVVVTVLIYCECCRRLVLPTPSQVTKLAGIVQERDSALEQAKAREKDFRRSERNTSALVALAGLDPKAREASLVERIEAMVGRVVLSCGVVRCRAVSCGVVRCRAVSCGVVKRSVGPLAVWSWKCRGCGHSCRGCGHSCR